MFHVRDFVQLQEKVGEIKASVCSGKFTSYPVLLVRTKVLFNGYSHFQSIFTQIFVQRHEQAMKCLY